MMIGWTNKSDRKGIWKKGKKVYWDGGMAEYG
jgi:hypothetical protein